MTSVKASPIIGELFIFCPELGEKEGEEAKKLLFYHPADHSEDVKVQSVGFCEAVVKFTESFASSSASPSVTKNSDSSCDHHVETDPPFHEVSTEKQLHVYCQVEGAFLLGLAANKAKAEELNYVLYAPTLHRVLITAYKMFRLFFGPFQRFFGQDGGLAALKHRLDYFFSRYLSSLKLNTMPLIDLFNGIGFMGLDPENFLKVETLVEQVTEAFPQIAQTIFLYQDKLLWYTVPKPDLHVLYRYLTQNLLPMSLRAEVQPEMQRKQANSQHYGKYVTGPSDLTQISMEDSEERMTGVRPPVIYTHRLQSDSDSCSTVSDTQSESTTTMSAMSSLSLYAPSISGSSLKDGFEDFHLIVYRALNATLAMLVPIRKLKKLEMEFFRNLDSLLGPLITQLASHIGDLYSKQLHPLSASLDPAGFQFIFFNPVSLSLKTSFQDHTDSSQMAGFLPGRVGSGETGDKSVIPINIAKLVCELRDQSRCSEGLGDLLAKSDSEYWVVAKKHNQRELYLILSPKQASLTEVHEEVKRILSTYFDHLFVAE